MSIQLFRHLLQKLFLLSLTNVVKYVLWKRWKEQMDRRCLYNQNSMGENVTSIFYIFFCSIKVRDFSHNIIDRMKTCIFII